MGNKLLSEKEIIHEKLSNITANEDICTWTSRDNFGNLYDVSGSGKHNIVQYARIHKSIDPVVAKMICTKSSLGKPTFINVRRSTIIRTYENNPSKENVIDDIIIGDYLGISYDITTIVH